MCDFISWKKDRDGRVFFLTDNEVFSPHGKETLLGTKDNDVIGHGAIDAFYGPATRHLEQFENRYFWDKKSSPTFPPQIAEHLESPQTLLDTWGKMLKEALQPDDALFIIKHAPEPWKSALMDICIEAVAKDPDYSYRAWTDLRSSLGEDQRTKLILGIAQNPRYSLNALHRFWHSIGTAEKDLLIASLSKDRENSCQTLTDFRGRLNKSQKNVLFEGLASCANNALYALHYLSSYNLSLSEEQVDRLFHKLISDRQEDFRYLLGLEHIINKDRSRLIVDLAKTPAKACMALICCSKFLDKGQRNALVTKIAKDSECAGEIISEYSREAISLTKGQIDLLINSAARNLGYAQGILFNSAYPITHGHKDVLVRRLAKNQDSAYKTLCQRGRSLSKGHRDLLVQRMAVHQSSALSALYDAEVLSEEQRDTLIRKISKSKIHAREALSCLPRLNKKQKDVLRKALAKS